MSYDVLHARDVTGAGNTVTANSVRFKAAHLASTVASGCVLYNGTTAGGTIIGALSTPAGGSDMLQLPGDATMLCPNGITVSVTTAQIFHLTVYTEG